MKAGVVYGLIFLLSATQWSCSNPELDNPQRMPQVKAVPVVPEISAESLITSYAIGRARIGMPIGQLKTEYPDCSFEEMPVHEYGIDGDSKGLLLTKNSLPFLFAWTNEGEEQIKGLVAMTRSLTTKGGYRVGMTSGEIARKCPGCHISPDMLDDRIEYVPIPGTEIRLEFITSDSTRIGRYRFNHPEPKSRILKPDQKVQRISIIAGQEMQ